MVGLTCNAALDFLEGLRHGSEAVGSDAKSKIPGQHVMGRASERATSGAKLDAMDAK